MGSEIKRLTKAKRKRKILLQSLQQIDPKKKGTVSLDVFVEHSRKLDMLLDEEDMQFLNKRFWTK